MLQLFAILSRVRVYEFEGGNNELNNRVEETFDTPRRRFSISGVRFDENFGLKTSCVHRRSFSLKLRIDFKSNSLCGNTQLQRTFRLQSYQPEELSIAGSFPRDFHYGDAENDLQVERSVSLPKILLMGHTRSGKSSIVEVVFHKMNSTETLYLESNNEIKKERIRNSPFIQLEIWDVYGNVQNRDA